METFLQWPGVKRQRPDKIKAKPKRQPQIGKLTHNLLNQLSVIQLSCFSLRQRLKKNPDFSLSELDAMEKAILEAAELSQTIYAKLKESGDRNQRGAELTAPLPASKTNVYPFPKPPSNLR
jgi:hypothetical protein